MGNTRKPQRPDLNMRNEPEVRVPMQEQSVHKKVPAVIHWATVPNVDREDDETIGEAIIYEDGTSDVIVFSEISDDAKKLVGTINQELDHLNMED